jgi:hypothetical protein
VGSGLTQRWTWGVRVGWNEIRESRQRNGRRSVQLCLRASQQGDREAGAPQESREVVMVVREGTVSEQVSTGLTSGSGVGAVSPSHG